MEETVKLYCFYCRAVFSRCASLLAHIESQCQLYHRHPLFREIKCGNCISSAANISRFKCHILRCHVKKSESVAFHFLYNPPMSRLNIVDNCSSSMDCDLADNALCPTPYSSPSSYRIASVSNDDSLPTSTSNNKPLSNDEIAGKLTYELASIAAKSFENIGMMEKTVQFYLERFMHYQQMVYSWGLENLYRRYSETGMSDCCEETLMTFLYEHKAIMEAAYKPMRSTHSRLNFFIKQGTYIEPESIFVVDDNATTDMRVVGQDVPEKPSDNHIMFVPMRKVLKKLFEIPGFFRAVVEWEKINRKSTEVNCFIESDVWLKAGRERKHGRDESYFFPINLYFDDFETGNPLGSHAGKQKLGAVYYSLPFLPPRLVSKMKFIMLALVFKSRVREKVGNKAIFRPVIDELNFLYQHGIQVMLENGQSIVIKFALGCLIGDNLGLNTILGFSTSFRSMRCCRFCRITKNEYHKVLVEDPTLLRTKNNHFIDIEAQDPITGVVEHCTWYELPYFSIDTHISVDFMHDMFEGIACYVMQVVLKGLISRNNVLDINYLNDRIKNLSYGPDSHCKPTTIASPKPFNFTIRMSASEMRTFVAYFGLMVGHLITVTDYDPPNIPHNKWCSCKNQQASVSRSSELRKLKKPKHPFSLKRRLCRSTELRSRTSAVYQATPYIDRFQENMRLRRMERTDDSEDFYKLYLQLNHVITLISQDAASPKRALNLRNVIAVFLTTFINVSNKINDCAKINETNNDVCSTSLPPKFHFLTHYPTMMLRHGPLTPLSSMRFESKNKELKTGLKNSFNNINTPFSAAKKEQYHFNNFLFENTLSNEENEYVKQYPILEPDLSELCSALELNDDDGCTLTSIKTITTGDGLTFIPGYVVIVDEDENNPEFAKIVKLYQNKITKEVYFKGEDLFTVTFSIHYKAYEVESLGSFSYYKLSNRLYSFPNTFVNGLDGRSYVLTRYIM